MDLLTLEYESTILFQIGSSSSVGIATDYRLDGLGSNPGGDEIFLVGTRFSARPDQP